MDNLFYAWLIIAILFVLLEMGAPGLLFFLSFAFGAAISAFSTFFIFSFMQQCLIFLVATIVALWVLNAMLKRKMYTHNATYQKTNIYALQGKLAVVVKTIAPGKFGEVKLGGELWSARAVHNANIEVDTEVKVVDVRGAHVIVEPVHK
ncbi:MAG: NfeD family protein [bacterium]|nr:NfeD family protein [bacterium]